VLNGMNIDAHVGSIYLSLLHFPSKTNTTKLHTWLTNNFFCPHINS